MPREIIHVDMDAFYASVEIHDDPSLLGKAVIVGGGGALPRTEGWRPPSFDDPEDPRPPTRSGGTATGGPPIRSSGTATGGPGQRGVVCAASYEARKFGVRSAMSMAEARRRCPHAIILPVRMHRYVEVSAQVFEIFHAFTPLVEGLSLDEAFLDVTSSQALFGDGLAIARKIRERIKEELGLVASAGVARTKFTAKIASDLEKPNALVDLREQTAERLAALPTTRMWGVGAKSLPRLLALGLRTFGDFQRAEDEWLRKVLGEVGVHYKMLAWGIDPRPVVPSRDAKSMGAERTYEAELVGHEAIAHELLAHAETVAARMVQARLVASTISIKLKTDAFELLTRQTSLSTPVSDTTSIYRAALVALDRLPIEGRRFRLCGVHVSDLVPAGARPMLFRDKAQDKRDVLEKTLAALDKKLGSARSARTVTRADLISKKPR